MQTAVELRSRISSFEFSPDSSLIAAGSPESCIRLWSLKGERLRRKFIGELGELRQHFV